MCTGNRFKRKHTHAHFVYYEIKSNEFRFLLAIRSLFMLHCHTNLKLVLQEDRYMLTVPAVILSGMHTT